MRRIAILGALGRELKYIKDNINITKTMEIKGYRFSQGYFMNLEIILGITSVGKVNAALCTEILINNFNPDYIINTGIAGAMTDKTEIFDLVIAESVNYHDVEEYILTGVFPFISVFPSDNFLIEKAKEASNMWNESNKIYTGKIISGDSFISSKEEKSNLLAKFNPLCVEMEGGAIAHTCYINRIPFIEIRSISDKADDSARELYKKNEVPAANKAGEFIIHYIQFL